MSTNPDIPLPVSTHGPLGRRGEAARLDRFLRSAWPRPSLLIVGEAGIGKSTLWRHAVDESRARGVRVLETSASEAESDLAFSGLIDLFEDVLDDILGELSDIQREALEVAFLRRRSDSELPKIALSSAVLSMLRALARDGRVLLAVDDLQWLEAESLNVITYALRRIKDEPVAALATIRTPSVVEEAFGSGHCDLLTHGTFWENADQLRIGGLDLAAMSAVMAASGLDLPADRMRQVWERTQGNPLWAVEIGGSLRDAPPHAGDELPLPQSVANLLRARVAALPAPARQALTVVAALGRPAPLLVRRVLDRDDSITDPDAAIDEAVDSGVVAAKAGRLVPTHPLLATAAVSSLAPSRRRRLHGNLAHVVGDVEARAHHLQQARDAGPDEEVAAALQAAAHRAADRGAPHAAARLAEQAVQRTPDDSPARAGRVLDAATWHYTAGDFARVYELLEPVCLDELPLERFAYAVLFLFEAAYLVHGRDTVRPIVERTLAAVRTDDLRHALVRSSAISADYFPPEEREQAALAAIEVMERAGYLGPLLHHAYQMLVDERVNGGSGLDDAALARMEEIERSVGVHSTSETAEAARGLAWRLDDVVGARQALQHSLKYATAVGEEYEIGTLYAHAVLTELTAGDYAQAAELLSHIDRGMFGQSAPPPVVMSAIGMLYVGQGRFGEIPDLIAEHAPIPTQRVAYRVMYAHALRGLVAARTERWDDAVEELSAAMRASERLGTREPGKRLRIDAELAEAYVAVGNLAGAEELAAGLHELGERQRRATLRGSALRIRGLIAAAEGDLTRAEELLARAVATLEDGPVPLELGRALLELGRVRRRRRARRSAREALSRARDMFAGIGDLPFERRATAELERLAALRAGDGFTETEQRVAELVATGATNREVAAALYISVRTVESHMQAIYRKTGARSRAELLTVLLNPREP